MEFLLTISILIIIHLIHVLSHLNPFDRCIKRRAYTAQKSLNLYDCSIRFSKDANLDCLYEAIFSAMYQAHSSSWEYRNPSISFENFIRWNCVVESFRPFCFSTISFDDVEPDDFQCRDFLLLPCEQLVLPRRISSIDFCGYEIPHIKELVIRSSHFVPLVSHADYATDPLKSDVPINISVPQDLLKQYRTDPVWSSLRFVGRDGNIAPATFNGLAPIDHEKQSRCVHC